VSLALRIAGGLRGQEQGHHGRDGDEDDREDDDKKGKPLARSDSLRAKQHAPKKAKQKAAKAKGNAAVITRLDAMPEARLAKPEIQTLGIRRQEISIISLRSEV
jgi:hypothetical protein